MMKDNLTEPSSLRCAHASREALDYPDFIVAPKVNAFLTDSQLTSRRQESVRRAGLQCVLLDGAHHRVVDAGGDTAARSPANCA